MLINKTDVGSIGLSSELRLCGENTASAKRTVLIPSQKMQLSGVLLSMILNNDKHYKMRERLDKQNFS